MMTDDDDVYELYTRFKQEIKSRAADIYYDEEELALIFDIAGDERDTFVQTEVLMLGRRLWPASDKLTLRQGLLIEATSDWNIDDFLQTYADRSGVLWDILRLRARHLSPKEGVKALSALLHDVTLTEDEEIIQFAALVEHFGAYAWFKDHYKTFIDKSAYRDTALNEAAHILEKDYPELCIRLTEEMSQIDPFNAVTWENLANLYLREDRVDDALSAIDYAKAISPDDSNILLSEATIYMEKDAADPHVADLLQNLVTKNPDWATPKRMLAQAYIAQGKGDIADMLIEENPDILIPEGTDEEHDPEYSIENFYFDSSRMKKLISSNPAEALEMLRDFDQRHDIREKSFLIIQLMYETGDMEGVIEFVDRDRSYDNGPISLEPLSLTMYAAAFLRLGRLDEARKRASNILDKLSEYSHETNSAMILAGSRIALRYIIEQAEQGRWSPDADPIAEALK